MSREQHIIIKRKGNITQEYTVRGGNCDAVLTLVNEDRMSFVKRIQQIHGWFIEGGGWLCKACSLGVLNNTARSTKEKLVEKNEPTLDDRVESLEQLDSSADLLTRVGRLERQLSHDTEEQGDIPVLAPGETGRVPSTTIKGRLEWLKEWASEWYGDLDRRVVELTDKTKKIRVRLDAVTGTMNNMDGGSLGRLEERIVGIEKKVNPGWDDLQNVYNRLDELESTTLVENSVPPTEKSVLPINAVSHGRIDSFVDDIIRVYCGSNRVDWALKLRRLIKIWLKDSFQQGRDEGKKRTDELTDEQSKKYVAVLERYEECVRKLWTLFDKNPLGDHAARSYISRLEGLIKHKYLIPKQDLKNVRSLFNQL